VSGETISEYTSSPCARWTDASSVRPLDQKYRNDFPVV